MSALARFARDETGTTLVELTMVVALLLLLLFALIDFGRLAHHVVAAESATGIAGRLAAVRPAACTGVPDTYGRGSNAAVRYGEPCTTAGACTIPAAVTCLGAAGNATAAEIWGRIAPLLPPGATVANLRFRYAADYARPPGFLGGPYVPTVTVELTGLAVPFATPLGLLADLASGTGTSTLPTAVPLPSMSVSLPGEDLALGTNG